MKPQILIVDDDEDIRSQLRWALSADFDVTEAEDRPSAMKAFTEKKPEVVLVDLGLPPHPGTPQEGIALIGDLLSSDSATRVVVISGQGEKENALRAVGEGAYDFFCKPVNVEELKTIIGRAFHVGRLEREYQAMQRQFETEGFEGMLGKSPAVKQVFTTVRKLDSTDAPVLVLGESGTGKEVVALTIHRRSKRAKGPFVAINCGAIPETLIEAELFGHERGAFTGAHTQRPGKIETAEGGTLFLDEIGELPLALQVKLLRFLQEQQIERIGGRKQIRVDTRVIAATNVDLERAMGEGKFREDLFYRLAVVVIKLPPLRERETDVVVLAEAFLKRYASDQGKGRLRFSKEALLALQEYSWPGNVRELENRVKRAVIMADDLRVSPENLSLTSGSLGVGLNLREARDQLEREMLTKALRKHRGKISPAAADLGISRPTFYEMMEKLGIQKPSDEEPRES
ncbi:MAG TPA: PEP-CTERM-box response regulator transcription factor [Verrucomicrobiae bacterium]